MSVTHEQATAMIAAARAAERDWDADAANTTAGKSSAEDDGWNDCLTSIALPLADALEYALAIIERNTPLTVAAEAYRESHLTGRRLRALTSKLHAAARAVGKC